MDGKGVAILGVGVIGAAAIMFYGSQSETNTAERAVVTAKQDRAVAEHDARMAREFGDLTAAKKHDERATEADLALANAKEQQAHAEAAAKVRNDQLVEAAGGDISRATGTKFETGTGKSLEELRQRLN